MNCRIIIITILYFSCFASLLSGQGSSNTEEPCFSWKTAMDEGIIQAHFNKIDECISSIDTGSIETEEFPYYYYYKGRLATHKGQFNQAVGFYENSLSHTENKSDSITLLLSLSKSYRKIFLLEKSLNLGLKALKMSEKEQISFKIEAISNLITLNYVLNDSIAKNEYEDQLENIFSRNKKMKGTIHQGNHFFNMAHNSFSMDKWESVLDFLNRAEKIFNKNNFLIDLGHLYDIKGTLMMMIGDDAKGLELYEKSMALKEKLNHNYGKTFTLNNLGNFYSEKNQYQKSISKYNEALKYAEDLGLVKVQRSARYSLSILYYQKGDYKKGIINVWQYDSLNEIVNNIVQKNAVIDMQEKYKNKEHKTRINNLEVNDKLKTQQRNILLSSTFALLGLLIYLFHLFNQKRILNKELKELIGFREKVFTIIGHDLRGGVTQLKLTERKLNLLKKEIENPKYPKYTSDFSQSLDGLQRLVENLLYWGREQADNLFISQEEIPVRRIAEHVIYDFNSSLEMKNITLINNIPQEEEIFMDMNIMKLVLRNLIANAIKFSHKEGVITLASTEKGICVSDNGVGIPEDKLNQLFDLKDGKSTKGTNGEEGTGLGLWLCQQILKKCSAKISVTSELDKGTTFFIDFEE